MAAALNGNIDIVSQLVHGGRAVLSMTDSRGSTALVYAVKGGHRNIVEFFLSCEGWFVDDCLPETNNKSQTNNGVKCDQLNETVQEALIWASKLGHMEILETLLCNDSIIPVNINEKCTLTGMC